MYLQALHLIKSSSDEWMDPLVDSALCLKLEDLPTDVRLAIYKTGLFRKQDHLLPIISVVATWDPRVRLPHQFPVNAVLSMGLPALRLLRTLQNRVNPNAKAPLRTATLLFTLEHMVCFLHTLEPGTDEPARTTIIEQAGGGMDLSNLRFVQHLKVKLHTCFIQALDLSPYSINDRLGIKIDEWTTTEGLHERFAHSVRLGQAQDKIDTDTDTDTESDRSGWSHRSASTPATSNIGQEGVANV
ncbi:hypothetical protein OC844_007296 [Tilletia horrida]|nr:hypothetical protein OC844_007296 [Tilletia horrida]